MNLISLENYSRINEAIIGLRNIITVDEFKQLEETEQKNIIKLLLLNSGDGTGLFENLSAVNHVLIDSGFIEESNNLFESINESQLIIEDWDDDVSTGIAATGAAAGAAALSLAAYISFLFKKKKIRKAWDEVKNIQKTKVEKDVVAYEDKMDLNAKVSKEKFEQFKADKEKEIEKLEKEKAEKTGPNAADELKQEINALKIELAKLDPVAHPAPEKEDIEPAAEDPAKKEPKEEKTEKTEESLKEADEEKPKDDKPKDDKPKDDKPKDDKPKSDDKPTEKKPESDGGSDEGGSGEKGQKQLAKEKLDKAIEDEEANLEKEKKKISDKKSQNSDQRQKIKDGAGSTEQKNKKVEKLSKEDQKLSDKAKELEEEGSKAKQKAQSEYEGIKQDLANKEEKLAELKADKANILDPKQKAAIAKEYDEQIKDLKTDISDREKETRPDPEASVKKETISKALERDIEQLSKEQAAAEENAQRISGVDKDGKATGIGGKVLGFSASFTAELKAANKQELLNAEKDALLQKASIDQQQIDAMSKDAAKKKEKQASNIDQEIADAAEKEKNSQKALSSEVKSVDASDEDIAKADAEVKKKQEEEESRQAEEKKDQTNDKKDAISKQIEKHEKTIEALKKEVADKGGKPKEAAQYKLEKAKEKLDGAKEQYAKLGESFNLKFQLAMIGEEINSIMTEYNLIVEGTRKELIPEEEEKKEKAKDDVEKDKKKIDNLKGSKDKEKGSEDEDGDGIKDPEDVAKDIEEESKKKDKSNPLIGKKVVLKNMRDKDLGQLDGAEGEVIKSFEENEREPEGDMPRRTGDPIMYKIKFDKPQDPMYPEINLPPSYFEEAKKKEDTKEKAEESVANKFRNALNEASRLPQLEELKKLQQKVYDSSESGAIDLWEDYAKRVIGVDGDWSKAPEGSWPKAIKELENICTKYRIK